jgi:tetratricopeptide (TPR) repeat protein
LRDFETVAQKGQSIHYIDALRRAALLAYHHTMDFNKSFAHYTKLHELVSDPAQKFEAELGILRSAYRSGRMPEAMQWSAAIVKNNLSTDAIRSEAYFYGGKAAFDQKQYEEALVRFEQVTALSQNEQAAESRYRVAQIYFFGGQFDIAEEACNSANEKNANYPYWVAKSLILLSDIAVEKKDLFNAKAPLEAVIENFQGDAAITQEAQQKLDRILTLEKQQSKIQQDTGNILHLQIIDDEKNN